MSKTIRILSPVVGDGGALWAAGTVQTTSDGVANDLVNRKIASFTIPQNPGASGVPQILRSPSGLATGLIDGVTGLPLLSGTNPLVLATATRERVHFAPSNITSVALQNQSWQRVISTFTTPYAVRGRYESNITNAFTIDKTAVAASDTYVHAGDPTNGGAESTFVPLTWAGAASVVVPAAASNAVKAYSAWSDLVFIQPLPRVDVAGGLNLFHVRSFIANGGAVNYGYEGQPQDYGNYPGNNANQTSWTVNAGGYMGGDMIGNPSGWSGGNADVGLSLPMELEFTSLTRVIRIAGIGDSLTANSQNGAVKGAQLYSLGHRLASSLNTKYAAQGIKFCYENEGWSSQTYPQIYARLAPMLAALQPHVVLLPVFSPNSQLASQSDLNVQLGYVVDAIAQIREAGAIPILWTGTPFNTASAINTTWRRALNTMMLNFASQYNIPIVDVASAAGDGTAAEQWIPTLSTDGLHWSDPGLDQVFVKMFLSIVASALSLPA